MTVDTLTKLRCAQRELGLRRAVYPRMVARGQMSQAFADYQLNAMEAIVRDYEDTLDRETGQGKLL